MLLTMVCLCIVLSASPSRAAVPKEVAGTIIRLRVNDLRFARGLPKEERGFVATLVLDSVPDMTLGLRPSEDGDLDQTQQAMLSLLQAAFENDWRVTIRWTTRVRYTKPRPPYANIVSVSVKR